MQEERDIIRVFSDTTHCRWVSRSRLPSHPTVRVSEQSETTGHSPQDLCPVKYLCENLKSGMRDCFELLLTQSAIILSE
jgi:hypothetical protein